MSLLPTPVSTPEARSRLSMDRMKKTVTAGIKRSQSVKLPPAATPRTLFTPCGNGEPRELLRCSRSARPFPSLHKRTLSLDAARHNTLPTTFDGRVPLQPIPSDVDENARGMVDAGPPQCAEVLTSQVTKMQSEWHARAATEDALRLELHNVTMEKDALRQHVHSLQEVVRSSSRRMND